ncbi:hypothetical protein GCM10017708_20310 [Arthrobacter citreus]
MGDLLESEVACTLILITLADRTVLWRYEMNTQLFEARLKKEPCFCLPKAILMVRLRYMLFATVWGKLKDKRPIKGSRNWGT